MENGKMKNIVVLKDLPSNLVEEAIVILKSNKKAKKLERIEKTNRTNKNGETKKEKDYILKEAEMLVSNYISKIENNTEQRTIKTIKNSKKYVRLKRYAYLSSLVIVIQALILVIT